MPKKPPKKAATWTPLNPPEVTYKTPEPASPYEYTTDFLLLAAEGFKTYTFPNDTKQSVNDLHLKYDRAIAIEGVNGKPPKGQGQGNYSLNYPESNVVDIDDIPTPKGNSAVVRAKSVNSGKQPVIKEWYWTRNSVRIGSIHRKPPKQIP